MAFVWVVLKAIVEAVVSSVWPMIADGRVRPVVHATVPMDRTADAQGERQPGGHRAGSARDLGSAEEEE